MLVVQKYGGSSLRTPEHIRRAARRIRGLRQEGAQVVAVVSAMGNTTDHLIRLAQKTVGHPNRRELDMLLTAGERVSMSLLAMALDELGVPAISFTGSQVGIVTTSDHTEARILSIHAGRVQEELQKGKTVIIAGFQGVSREKEVTTLGRGGSDTTAIALAALLKADRCEVLTDVKGLYSADPRLVPTARLISECHYDEALEFASLGAKMHVRSLEVARRFSVPVTIASSEGGPGTRLIEKKESNMEKTTVRGIATQSDFIFFRAELSLEELVSLTAELGIALRFFSASEKETRFVVESTHEKTLKQKLSARGKNPETLSAVSLVSAVGEGFSASPGLFPRFFNALKRCGAEPLLLSLNSQSITAAIAASKAKAATEALHRDLIESPEY